MTTDRNSGKVCRRTSDSKTCHQSI